MRHPPMRAGGGRRRTIASAAPASAGRGGEGGEGRGGERVRSRKCGARQCRPRQVASVKRGGKGRRGGRGGEGRGGGPELSPGTRRASQQPVHDPGQQLCSRRPRPCQPPSGGHPCCSHRPPPQQPQAARLPVLAGRSAVDREFLYIERRACAFAGAFPRAGCQDDASSTETETPSNYSYQLDAVCTHRNDGCPTAQQKHSVSPTGSNQRRHRAPGLGTTVGEPTEAKEATKTATTIAAPTSCPPVARSATATPWPPDAAAARGSQGPSDAMSAHMAAVAVACGKSAAVEAEASARHRRPAAQCKRNPPRHCDQRPSAGMPHCLEPCGLQATANNGPPRHRVAARSSGHPAAEGRGAREKRKKPSTGPRA